MRRFVFFSVILFVGAFLFLSVGSPSVFAKTTRLAPKKTIQYNAVGMTLTYTLRPRQFSLRATGMKNVSYVITYQRTGGKLTEALTGGGRTKNGLFTRSHFAGSQSSKYFIPHNVLSGHIQFDAITLKGENYSVNRDFVIRRGRLVYTN